MFTERAALTKSGRPRKGIYGVGINDATYVTAYKDATGKTFICPFYSVWKGMLDRCFSKVTHVKHPSYIGCTLEDSWKVFSVFKLWMQTQDWKGKHLDKDLIAWDNKHYGPDNCLFISPALNNLLTLRNNHRGTLPLGVSVMTCKGYPYFVASCSFYGKQKRLGYFKTSQEAAQVYKDAKLKYIAELADQETDQEIKQALLNLF